MESLESYIKIKREIREYFLEKSVDLLPDDSSDESRSYIQRILNGEKTNLERLFEGTPFEELLHDGYDLSKLDDLASDHFYSWYNGYDYIEGVLEIGAIVLRVEKIPNEMADYLNQMRSCFAFQQYLAVCVLCRTLIEITLRHICKLEGFFNPEHLNYRIKYTLYQRKADKDGRNFKIPEDYLMQPSDLRYLLNTNNHFKKFREPIAQLYSDLSRVVHGNRTIKKEECKTLAKKTMQLIHDLYEV